MMTFVKARCIVPLQIMILVFINRLVNKREKMKILTRGEELVLLSIWRLQDNAYCVPIREQLMEVTGQNWSFGSIYDALDRLEKKGYLESFLSEPQKSRGGRSKRIYKHTKVGLQAMIDLRDIQDKVWEGIAKPAIEKKL